MRTREYEYSMKKFAVVLNFAFGLLLCLPLFLVGCGQNAEKLSSYQISATYDDDAKSLQCAQSVEYVNSSDNVLNEVCFFLYANAFDEGQKVVSTSYTTRAYPNGESFGNIEFSSVEVGGTVAQFSISESGAILTVALVEELFPNEAVTIDMEFCVNLANIRHRLGYGNSTVNFGNFFPIACVYENGFVKNEFATNGDPFYSDVSNFEVEITYPQSFTLASTSEVTAESSNAGEVTATISAPKVRDFCFVLSEKFEKISADADGVTVNYYFYDDDNAQAHLETAVKAVETFGELFGKYPYSQLSVVKNDFCFGGMEYPNLVMIADDLDAETVDYVIVHEIAHQWWYGVVGNNEFTDAWVDEGLTEFSCALFYEKNSEYGLQYSVIMENARATYQNFVRIFVSIYGQCDESMDRNLNQFATEPEYVNCTYTKGMLLFDCVRSSMSDRKFFKCLRDYFEDYSFKNSSSERLIESFSKSAGINLEGLFKSWTNGTVKIGI